MNWLANGRPSWADYRLFMSGFLIALYKQSVVHPGGVGETWRSLFSKCVLRVTVPKATNAYQYIQICDRLKEIIDGAIHWVQDTWYTKFTTEYWGFLLIDSNTISTRSIQ